MSEEISALQPKQVSEWSKRTTCEHGNPFPRYANCDACREAIDREDEEADRLARSLLQNTEVFDAHD